jgi:uncharacterized coiled-coil protein SlyX
VPIAVTITALLAFAASAAVEQYRISQAEIKITEQSAQIEQLRETASDVKAMRRIIERMEAKLDRHIEEK